MTEKYPTWLIGHVKEWAEKRLPTVTLCSTTGNELLEVWYYGDLLTAKGEPQSYIVDGDDAPDWWQPVTRKTGGVRHPLTVDGMATTICSAMNMIHLSWSTVPSNGMRSLPPNWCWSWVTVSTMKTKKRTSNRMKRIPWNCSMVNGCRGNRSRDGIDYIALYYVNEKGKPVQILTRNWHE
ncbi:MAG: hypothetical protein ACLTK5_12890 [Clostridium sp.]